MRLPSAVKRIVLLSRECNFMMPCDVGGSYCDSHAASGSVLLLVADWLLSAAGKKFTGIPMCALLANKRHELLYNCGIQLLHLGRPLAAFECLMEAVQVYHANPRLWLRLAECCIAANKGVRMLHTHTHAHAPSTKHRNHQHA